MNIDERFTSMDRRTWKTSFLLLFLILSICIPPIARATPPATPPEKDSKNPEKEPKKPAVVQPGDPSFRGPFRSWGRRQAPREQGFRNRWRQPDPQEIQIQGQGFFLTADGFLDRSYHFTRQDETVFLNGQELFGPEVVVYPAGRFQSPMRKMIHALSTNGVVVQLDENHFVAIGDSVRHVELLDVLSPRTPYHEQLEKLEQLPIQGMTIDQWSDFLQRCDFTEAEYEAAAGAVLEPYRETVAENRKSAWWAKQIGWLDKIGFTYYLNLVGLMLVTLAFGTLLTQRPNEAFTDDGAAKQRARNLCWNTGLIVALSLFDLGCTLFAHLSGGFKELNPIGSALAENPMNLMLFKVLTLMVSAAILLALRHHPKAQWASWWLCLVLVILTFRWTTYHGMML